MFYVNIRAGSSFDSRVLTVCIIHLKSLDYTNTVSYRENRVPAQLCCCHIEEAKLVL